MSNVSQETGAAVESGGPYARTRPDSDAAAGGRRALSERRRDPVASTLGLVTFLGGVGIIVAAFFLARDMFAVPPDVALGIKQGETLEINKVVAAGIAILLKVVLLVVMAGFGSMVASRGIKLYAGGATNEKKDA